MAASCLRDTLSCFVLFLCNNLTCPTDTTLQGVCRLEVQNIDYCLGGGRHSCRRIVEALLPVRDGHRPGNPSSWFANCPPPNQFVNQTPELNPCPELNWFRVCPMICLHHFWVVARVAATPPKIDTGMLLTCLYHFQVSSGVLGQAQQHLEVM